MGDTDVYPIGEWTRTGSPGDIIILAGPDLSSAIFRFYDCDSRQFDRTSNVADDVAASVILPDALSAWSMYLVWPHDGISFGMPVAVNRTEAWWLLSERASDQATVGETVYIHGRNLAKSNGTTTSYVYVKPSGSAGQWATVTSVNPYRVAFTVPSLSAGSYDVWVHNGHGGHFGWSGPVALTVRATDPYDDGRDLTIIDVTDEAYGAVGNGSTDDTTAINDARAAAYVARPSTLYFPTGTYVMNDILTLIDHVTFMGDGPTLSIIVPGDDFTTNAPNLALLQSGGSYPASGIKDLAFYHNNNLVPASNALISIANVSELRMDNVLFDGGSCESSLNPNSYLLWTNSSYIGSKMLIGASDHVRIDNVSFKMKNTAIASLYCSGGHEISVTNCVAQDYNASPTDFTDSCEGRFFATAGNFGSCWNQYLADNQTINFAPIADAYNTGEQFLFETLTGITSGTPSTATANSVTFNAAIPGAGVSDAAMIIKGRGTGQARLITDVVDTTITVEPDWNVVPDISSLISIVSMQTRTVVYHNTQEGKTNYASGTASAGTELYGNVSNVIYANNTVTRVNSGATLFSVVNQSHITNIPCALFFNLIADNSVDGAYSGLTESVFIENAQTPDPDTIAFVGNTFRNNTVSNIVSHGIEVHTDNPKTPTDFYSLSHFTTFERNNITDLSDGFANDMQINKGDAIDNLHIVNNTFDRGTATYSGSIAFANNSPYATFFRSGNQWLNFETSATDPDEIPDYIRIGTKYSLLFAKLTRN